MSVSRYELEHDDECSNGRMVERYDGDYVEYAEYESMERERDELQAEIDRLRGLMEDARSTLDV